MLLKGNWEGYHCLSLLKRGADCIIADTLFKVKISSTFAFSMCLSGEPIVAGSEIEKPKFEDNKF
jgi:hypothetical protein